MLIWIRPNKRLGSLTAFRITVTETRHATANNTSPSLSLSLDCQLSRVCPLLRIVHVRLLPAHCLQVHLICERIIRLCLLLAIIIICERKLFIYLCALFTISHREHCKKHLSVELGNSLDSLSLSFSLYFGHFIYVWKQFLGPIFSAQLEIR